MATSNLTRAPLLIMLKVKEHKKRAKKDPYGRDVVCAGH
jgi:hypothetical protein